MYTGRLYIYIYIYRPIQINRLMGLSLYIYSITNIMDYLAVIPPYSCSSPNRPIWATPIVDPSPIWC